ncbi:MAG: minichromosome maintenance protein MCM [Methanocellales archaeon]|nr:minichromosome maintenance protein MCM [Methanocellales archaeon]
MPVSKWEEFLKQYYKQQILQLANSYPDERSLIVEFPDIERYDVDLADSFLERPHHILQAAEEALKIIDLPIDVSLDRVHVRVIKVPERIYIRDLRSDNISKLISIEGIVRKATAVRPKVTEAAFQCVLCDGITLVLQNEIKFREPYECNDCKRKGPFKLVFNESSFIDAQKLQIQESPEELRGGEQPQTIDVNVEDDLTGQVVPGDRVVVTGILHSYQRTVPTGKSTFFDVYLEGISIEIQEQEFEALEISRDDEKAILELSESPNIYEIMVNSIAPSIFGYEDIKEAMALQLFSGIPKSLPDGTRVRGDVHLLLVGDPGTAKSQLLRYVAKLAPRGIYTSGKGTSAAGLTAAAVKDEFGEGRWTLEAGALVLADKGIVAVDEIDKMRPEDRSALHEAMEQQTISIAKAGVVASLRSRCALLGAANPKYGRFDKYEPIANQIHIPPALLSRFDLIFPVMDEPNIELDAKIADHILKAHYAGELSAHVKYFSSGKITKEEVESAMETVRPATEPELMRKYIAYAKRIYPIMSDDARKRLRDFYLGTRKQGDDGAPVPVTARSLEALVRLAEASARMRLSDKILEEDADRVIRITDACLRQVGIDRETGLFDVDVIAVGITKSQRDKIKLIKDIIRELEREHGGAPPKEEVYDKAEESGIERRKAEELIAKLKQQGDVYEPGSKFIKIVKE